MALSTKSEIPDGAHSPAPPALPPSQGSRMQRPLHATRTGCATFTRPTPCSHCLEPPPCLARLEPQVAVSGAPAWAPRRAHPRGLSSQGCSLLVWWLKCYCHPPAWEPTWAGPHPAWPPATVSGYHRAQRHQALDSVGTAGAQGRPVRLAWPSSSSPPRWTQQCHLPSWWVTPSP